MSGFAFRRLAAGLLLAAPLALASCREPAPSETGEGPPQQVPITLANHTPGSVITLLAPGETSGCAGCELHQGGHRLITLSLKNGEVTFFRAMFGGVAQDDVECKWTGQVGIMVDYLNGNLTCVNWEVVASANPTP